jgi:iron(III) transport system substrate-binding protein
MSVQRKKMRRMSRHLLVPIGAAALLASACSAPAGTGDDDGGVRAGGSAEICEGSDAVDLVDSLEGLSPEDREEKLLQEAIDAGGTIDFYTEINDPETITEPFQDKYGDLEVNTYRAGSESIRQRILEETDANFSGADLIEMDSLEMAVLDKQKMLAPVSSPWEDQISEAAVFDNFIGDRLSYIVPGWNTTKIDAADVPKSLEDFANVDGLAMEGSDVFWFAGQVENMEAEGKSRDEAVQVFKDIAANAAITDGHTTQAELVVAGQYSIAINNYIHRMQEQQADGAPVEYRPVNITVVAVGNATALHCVWDDPAGAVLLRGFLLSPEEGEGQHILLDQSRTPAIAELAQESFGGEQIEPIEVDVLDVAEHYSEWSDLWDEVIRSSGN